MTRHAAGGVIVLFQGTLILSGNLSFLNWLTIVPALASRRPGLGENPAPRAHPPCRRRRRNSACPCRPQEVVAYAVAGVVALLSINPVANMFSRNQIMNTSFDPLHLVNTYGAFGTVGRERLNVVFEGTHADVPDETAEWKAYSYKGLPVDPGKMPPQVAPYQLRLDWQMWFASMSIPAAYPWVFHLIWKLLHNDANALGLFASNPFPNNPARYIRAVLYRYSFAKPGNEQGDWWNRERLALWLGPLSAGDPRLAWLLRRVGWLSPAEERSLHPSR